jgi:hypothetical protein
MTQQRGRQDVAVTIPLREIWGNVAAESKPLRGLEPEFFVARNTAATIEKSKQLTPDDVEQIREKAEQSFTLPLEIAMSQLSRDANGKTKSGFAVKGTGREALQGAHAVLVKGEQASKQFDANEEVTIVFFAYPAQPGVGIERIQRIGNVITVTYFLRSHGLMTDTWRLALIPLGKLPEGKYRVELIRSSNEAQHNQKGFPPVEPKIEERIICSPFEFGVDDTTQ